MEFEKVREEIQKISSVGTHREGGTNRVFGTQEYREGLAAVKQYFEESGLHTYVDSVDNVHGIWYCGKKDVEEILIGSHIDTVKQGGMFDGLLGVVAAVEAAKKIEACGCSMQKDIHIIGTNGEEGNECGGTFGSRAMMGLLPLEEERYLQTARKYGYTKEDMEQAILDTSRSICYLELHIEQGPTLANRGEQIGIVTGIVGLQRYKVTVSGISNHAGTTMMEDRKDALVQAAGLILMGDKLAREMGHSFVETVALLQIFPSSTAVIPGKVEMVVEIRNESEERMEQFLQEYQKRAQEIADVVIEPIVKKKPVKCEEELVKIIGEACRKEGMSCRRMPSGATHDGNAFAMKLPIGMIFVPSENGISHSWEEWTNWDDIDKGVTVLVDVLKAIGSQEEW